MTSNYGLWCVAVNSGEWVDSVPTDSGLEIALIKTDEETKEHCRTSVSMEMSEAISVLEALFGAIIELARIER